MPATSESSKLLAQPTLLELSSKAALNKILNPDFKGSDFEDLEPRMQSLLFEDLRSEITRLRDFEREVTDNCPQIDLKLYQDASKPKPVDEVDILARYNQLTEFRADWSYDRDSLNLYNSSRARLGSRGHVRWLEQNLMAKSIDSDFIEGVWSDILKAKEKNGNKSCLDVRISPQLLLQRVIFAFGMPKWSGDNTKLACEVTLYHKDGISTLVFDHLMGKICRKVCASFEGTPDTSNEALKLLSFLCGTKFVCEKDLPYNMGWLVAGVRRDI